MTESGAASRLSYPLADRDEQPDVLHGTEIRDPYRYLEDPDAERTVAFVRDQNALSEPYLAGLASAGYFRELETAILTRPRAGTPFERGGRYFRTQNPGTLNQDRLYTGGTLAELLDSPTLVLDPNLLAEDGTAALVAAEPSPDGRAVAIAVSEAGSDWMTISLRDAISGEPRDIDLKWAKWLPPTWLPDGSGVLYWRYPEPDGQEYVDRTPPGQLVLHRWGTEQSADEVIWEAGERGEDWIAFADFSGDGRYLMFTAAPGTDSRTLVWLRPTEQLADPSSEVWLVSELADAHQLVDVIDDQVYLRTEAGAERGRFVRCALAEAPDFEDVILPADDEILVSVHRMRSGWLAVTSKDTAHQLTVHHLDGTSGEAVDIGYPASVSAVHARAGSDEAFVGTSSFTTRLTVQRLSLADGQCASAPIPSPGGEDGALAEVAAERISAPSADGTLVPMTVLRRADLAADGPVPTFLYGYGGFDVPLAPSFSALLAGWVQAGGVAVVANLRGGGEFGQAWHQAGMFERKQNVFDDLYGCAQELIARGITTTDQLAVHGRSNGGLLVGAAITQRPELWAAALPTVGVLDMLRYHLFTIGRAWASEYGNPDDPTAFGYLRAYSPLHNIREGTAYPPTLICTGDHDDRVVPAHSLKFGAELQYRQTGDAPILLRVDTRAGHGMGKPINALAAEYADQLAFAAEHTGLTPAR